MAGELDAKVWSELPREVLELVLRRLPISTLCKFRAFCKYWNTLPTIRAEDPFLLYIPRFQAFSNLGSCKLYSLTSKKWEVLDLSFVASSMALHFPPPEPYCRVPYVDRFCSDGGLLCLMGHFVDRGIRPRPPRNRRSYFSILCNPLTRTSKLLPRFECSEILDLAMHCNNSGAYKVIAGAMTSQPGLHLAYFYMYDSNSELWKEILTVKLDRGYRKIWQSCSVVFDGVYYFVSRGIFQNIYRSFELYAYNIKQNNWIAAGVKMGLDDLDIMSISFVVVNERLILSANSPPNTTWLHRLDGSEEMKLSETIAWRTTTTLAYRDSILLASHGSLMIVGRVHGKGLKFTDVVPVRRCNHPDCDICKWNPSKVNMAKVSFNVQATL